MRVLGPVAVASVGFASTPAFSVGLAECVSFVGRDSEPTLTVTEVGSAIGVALRGPQTGWQQGLNVEDFGSGLLAQVTWSESSDGLDSTMHIVEHCATAEAIGYVVTSDTWERASDAPAASAILREAIASSVEFNMGSLADHLRDHGEQGQLLYPEARQSCTCAVFYPEMIGDKIPWSNP